MNRKLDIPSGRLGGEFRFTFDLPPIPGFLPDGLSIPAPTADVGVALRVAL